jgi:outer membrane protein
MHTSFTPSLLKGILTATLLLSMTPHVAQAHPPDAHPSDAADGGWVHEGMAEEGRITGGFRVGPSFTTQGSGVSTVGPLVNFQGMYGLNKWFRAGMMLEWENHGVDAPGTGSVNTVTLLPVNLEYRPGHFGNLIPYVTTGIGVNINTHNVSDSFAWRVGGGVDYALTNLLPGAPQGMKLNVETAWKRNHANGDASTIGLLFGVRHTF